MLVESQWSVRPVATPSGVPAERGAFAAVTAPNGEAFAAASLYFVTGDGWSDRNCSMLRAAADALSNSRLPIVIGADFQVRPDAIATATVLASVGLRAVASIEKRATCRSSLGRWANIDWFAIRREDAAAVARDLQRRSAAAARSG